MLSLIKNSLSVILFLVIYANIVWADSSCVQQGSNSNAKEHCKNGSAASFDKRLPPVIPGEEIEHKGNKTKVWSTSGPVEVNEAPKTGVPGASGFHKKEDGTFGGVGIIVEKEK